MITQEVKKKKLNTPQTSKEERQFGEMVKSFLPKLESQWRFKDYDHHYDFRLTYQRQYYIFKSKHNSAACLCRLGF